MEKKDFKRIVKEFFKAKGFQFKGNNGYKLISDDYLIGLSLDHSPYCKGYFVEYGVVFLPDENKFPFKGFYDWNDRFLFAKDLNEKLENFQMNEKQYDEEILAECYEYYDRTAENLLKQLNINYELKVNALLDKEFVLKDYDKHLEVLARLPDYTIQKLLNLYGYDRREINRLRKQWGYNKFDF